jgi:uncharacterized protein YcbK (DUF882 family)
VRFLVAVIVMFGTAAMAAGALPSPSPAPARRKKVTRAPKKVRPPPVELTALNTHETFVLRPNPSGNFTKTELRGWNRFLRCHHTGRVHVMATRLAALIYQTAQHFNFGKVEVVAGYRAPKVAREKGNPKSPHKKGLACDFRVGGVPNTELRDFLRGAFARIGVGYYPNSDFVHLDVRQKQSAFWIDYSRPGERARYSRSPEEDLRAEQTQPETEEIDGLPGAPNLAPALTNSAGAEVLKTEGGQPQTAPSPGAVAPNLAGTPPVRR